MSNEKERKMIDLVTGEEVDMRFDTPTLEEIPALLPPALLNLIRSLQKCFGA